MFDRLCTWWSQIAARAAKAPPDQRDRGSTTENVIWIAALAALALTIIGIFGPEILHAANRVVFE
ncbi:hypothetical protein I6A60_38685 [Frankia sp. AgB1.9]|uniref:hypothetical protein n=1 Tax=unclassified Frankia TaxID=2632575 RepID=UPI0019349887|nr:MULTISPECIES: hypothetical protein [unclassified Frankia]MBL7487773.1 hypothetical protein [Frankia sp. AgW1.1]MBL7553717.1 hypothetical protein [Frankia sp. AgB1.9]MBL7622933.1 hypothetical protein [Frankia sp. AgB1.8]